MKNPIEWLLDNVAMKNSHFRDYVAWRSQNINYITVSTDEGQYHRDGILYNFHPMLKHSLTALKDYNFDGFNAGYNVLDIGASIGCPSMHLAKRIKDGGGKGHIFAVEPIYAEELKKNIKLNKIEDYINVFDVAVGIPGERYLSFYESKKVKWVSFADVLDMCGVKIQVAKLDYEGPEHLINPEDLKHIDIIEAEIHPYENYSIYHFLNILRVAGFKYNMTGNIVHARR